MKVLGEGVIVRGYKPSDEADWIRMRITLWPESDEAEARAWGLRRDAVTLVAEDAQDGELIGFAEVGKRPYADGCETNPVGFLEGWYVSPDVRGKGVGTKLVRAAVLWAKQEGLQELASDSLLDDQIAHSAHLAAGFEEVERSIKYRLALEDSGLPTIEPQK